MDADSGLHAEQQALAELKREIANFDSCVQEARRAALDSEIGPPDPVSYDELRGRLLAVASRLPPIYQESVCNPFMKKLDVLGKEGFEQILSRDRSREREAALMFDIAHALLQKADGYQEKATAAFQEVVSDLYDGFLSVRYRKGIRRPEYVVIPPLVKWGAPELGPYTWTTTATRAFDVRAGVVSLPPAHARLGIFAWTGLAHEAAGHDILSANSGLVEELSEKVSRLSRSRRAAAGGDNGSLPDWLTEYWASRIDEAAADVLGVLNMGPAAALGLVGYLRAMSLAYGQGSRLRICEVEHDNHPMDLLRGYLVAETVRLLRFDEREVWADYLAGLVDEDFEFTALNVCGHRLESGPARSSARAVARAIALSKLRALDRHSLSEIQNWSNSDEAVVSELEHHLTTLGSLHEVYVRGYYAAHVVAAAVKAALKAKAELPLILDRMLSILRLMHDENPSWGPLAIATPSDLMPMRFYVATPEQEGHLDRQRKPARSSPAKKSSRPRRKKG